MVRIIAGALGELVGPSVDDWMAIGVVPGHNALLVSVVGCHSDVTQDGAGAIIVAPQPRFDRGRPDEYMIARFRYAVELARAAT